MTLMSIDGEFSVCQLRDCKQVDLSVPFTFLSVTDDEISLVCKTSDVPTNTARVEHGWRTLKIAGVLDFGLIGIIAGISHLLAEHGISVFVISTYNTDYVLVKAAGYEQAVRALELNGYEIN